ncbi:hypothetical protein N0V83_005688 [Neocucurbitaria cava]|uniref:Uncharacterized protein n=1 Tax=Neocucurbitaria cava TaxID=798079 RepID=A0A9W9CLH8_9PLEO|nr:hypothetical protein N0V83_005688 [Neocucurbitaria cava]
MSDTAPHAPEGLVHGTDRSQPPNQPQQKEPNEHTPKLPDANLSAGSGHTSQTSNLRDFLASLKAPADRKFFQALGKDGVLRNLCFLPTPPDQPTGITVYDAKPMSPELIKAYLDRQPWSQATEDRFRGVDGRLVAQEHWLQPPPGVVLSRGSQNERDEEKRRWAEERKLLEEKIERGEVSAEDAGPACGGVQSNYDLRPR